MSATSSSSPSSPNPAPKSKWLRRLAIGGAVLIALLVVTYLTVTSGAFVRGFIIPRVGAALNAKLAVAEVSLSPFSELALRQVKLETTGTEPLLQAEELRVRYQLTAILGGHIVVPEITLGGPVVNVIQQADGTSNLDPLLRTKTKSPKPPTEPQPLLVDLGKLALSRGTLRFTQYHKDGSRMTSEMRNLELAVDHVKNGEAGKWTVQAEVSQTQAPAPKTTNRADVLQARLNGSFEFALDAKLMPTKLKGDLKAGITQAEGLFRDLAGLNASLACDSTPTEIRQAALRFDKAGQPLGQVEVRGPFDPVKLEARLNLDVSSLDRNVLNLVGAAQGLDFAKTTVNSSNVVDITRQGKVIGAKGRFTVSQFSLQRQSLTTPAMDLDMNYQFNLSLEDKTALLQRLNLTGRQAGADVLAASLDRPMNFSWGDAVHGLNEATLKLALTELDLKEWRAVLGPNPPTGKATAVATINAQQDGRRATVDLSAKLKDLSLVVASNRIDQAQVQASLHGQLNDFNAIMVDRFKADLEQHTHPLASIAGSASYDLTSADTRLQLDLDADVANVLREFPQPPLAASAGHLIVSALYAASKGEQNLTAKIKLTSFTGQFADYRFDDYQAAWDGDVGLKDNQVNVRHLSLALRQRADAGGALDLSGHYDPAKQLADVTFNLTDLNQNALAAFLAPALAPRSLASISVNLKGTAHYELLGASKLQLQGDISQFALRDALHPPAPFAMPVQLSLDATLRGQRTDITKLSLALPPTARATNRVDLTARLDLAKTNPVPSQLTLTADALDLTPIYDLFTTNQPAKPSSKPATAPIAQQPVAGAQPTEPAPVQLPIAKLSADLKIGRLFLRDITVSNWVASLKLDQGQATLKPLALSLNGAPVNGDASVDLTRPGFGYGLNLQATKVPLAPFANSFAPDKRDQFQADLYANAQVQGAGTTGLNLQKNLRGHVSFSVTNMNLQVVGPKTRRLLAPIALVLRLPELQETPLNVVAAELQLGQGQIGLHHFVATSPAFKATANGVIQIADVLTNSPLDLPVQVALRRSFAERVRLVPRDTPPNADYVPLPEFVKVAGTLGDPKTQADKTKIAVLLAEGIGGAVGSRAGDVISGVGGLLQGKNPLGGGLTNLLPNAKSDGKTNPPTKLNPFDLIPGLLQPKKN